MIRLQYALILSNTKLKSKRLLLTVSILISSILFAILIAGIVIFTGVLKSAVSYVQKANQGVYRVEVSPVIPQSVYSYDRPLSIETINKLNQEQKDYYANIETKYKAAGLKYDKSTEIPVLKPVSYLPANTPDSQKFDINFESPVVTYDQNLNYDAYVKTAKNTITDLKQLGLRYGASGYYTTGVSASLGIPNMMLVKDGKVDFGDAQVKGGDFSTYGYATNAIHNGAYEFKDDSLLQRYLLPGVQSVTLKGIPVVVSAQELVSLFGKEKGVDKEPSDAGQKDSWLKSIQSKFNGYTYQACYRNKPELDLIQQIQKDYADMVNNKKNNAYVAPALQYNLPDGACGDITVKKDTRTSQEKIAAQKLVSDQMKLGTYVQPQHKLLTFQVVGVVNAKHLSSGTKDVQSFLQSLLSGDGTSFSAPIPRELYKKLSDSRKLVDDISVTNIQPDSIRQAGLTTHVLDFKTIDDARSFMSNQTCPSSDTGCTKLFTANTYESNYVILDDIGSLFARFMLYALPAVLVLAAIIIWFMMVRVMSENRKETAVYRAMGAKRIDIMLIYMTYGMTIAFCVAIAATVLGLIGAYIINYLYSPRLTAIASSSFGVVSDGAKFNLFDVSSPYILLIIVAIFVVSFLAILQPIIRSVRRSPIKDIRNE